MRGTHRLKSAGVTCDYTVAELGQVVRPPGSHHIMIPHALWEPVSITQPDEELGLGWKRRNCECVWRSAGDPSLAKSMHLNLIHFKTPRVDGLISQEADMGISLSFFHGDNKVAEAMPL
jgi:hypothetical protein